MNISKLINGKSIIVIVVLTVLITSITYNVKHVMRMNKLRKKYKTENMSKEEVEEKLREVEEKLREVQGKMSRTERALEGGKDLAMNLLEVHIFRLMKEMQTFESLDKESYNQMLLGNQILTPPFLNMSRNFKYMEGDKGHDMKYVEIMKRKYGNTITYFEFKYPETKEEYLKLKDRYNKSLSNYERYVKAKLDPNSYY